jgi:predicted dehydrogenase/acetyltransferase-like isoleucine patch superfamily enzyme
MGKMKQSKVKTKAMNNPSVAVIGCGYWGKNLVRNFYELGALKLVCDKNEGVLSKIKDLYTDTKTCLEYDHALVEKDVQAVVIATPAETHYGLVRKALLKGKHVFVEKPLSLTEVEGRDVVDLAKKKKLTLMVGHILQYHGAVNKLKELIDSGELGKIQYLYSNRLNIGKIRSEENILWSFAPHDISVILMLLGEMPETVYATGGSYLQHQIPDTTLTAFDFPSGVKAHIFVSWLHPFKEQKLVVVGDKKMAVFDDISREKLLLYPHKIEWLQRIPVAAKADAETVPVDMEEPLKFECQHFLECVAGGKPPRTDGKEGLRVLKVLQALQESINQNGFKIKLGQAHETKKADRKKLSPDSAVSHEQEVNNYFVHESSYVDEKVEIGEGTRIWHFSHILSGSRIGARCNIGQNVVIEREVTVGDGCKVQNNVSIYKGVTLEDEVFCGPSMVFTNVYNPRAHIRRMDELRPTLVKKGATLGANCTIVCGVTIGRYSFVGAGSVVTRDIPDNVLVAGNPARQIGWMCDCGNRLDDSLKCIACEKDYKGKLGTSP